MSTGRVALRLAWLELQYISADDSIPVVLDGVLATTGKFVCDLRPLS